MPRSKQENEKIRTQTSKHLLKSALKVFAKHGYHGSTMAEIAKAAKLSKGLAYHYFKSKEELLVNLAEQRLADYSPLVFSLESIADPHQRLSFLIDFVFDELSRKTDELRFYNALYLHAEGAKAIGIAMQKYKAEFTRIFSAEEKLMKDLGFSNPILEATFLRSTLQGIALEYMLSPTDYPLKQIKKRLEEQYGNPRSS